MPSKLTVTGAYGPGLTATATVINDLNRLVINCDTQLITAVSSGQTKTQEFDVTGKSTVTVTLASGVWTIAIS